MKVKNNLSRMLGDIWNGRKQIEKLSTKALELNGEDVVLHQLKEGTAVNAIKASATATFGAEVVHGDTITVGNDVYEYSADGSETVAEGHILTDITADTVKASIGLDIKVLPLADETVKIGDAVYKFVVTPAAEGDVALGDNVADSQANLVKAINEGDDFNDVHPLVTISDFTTDSAVVTAKVGGTAGNNIGTTSTFSEGTNKFDDVSLDNGSGASNDNAGKALVTASANGTEDVAFTRAGAVVTIQAKKGGTIGNGLLVAKESDGVTLSAEKLGGGIDGTVGEKYSVLYDGTNLYIATLKNTVHDANWKYVAVSLT